MEHIKMINVNYLANPMDVFVVSAATDADLIVFQCRSSQSDTEDAHDLVDNIRYTIIIPRTVGDNLRKIMFPFGATNLQFFVNDELVPLDNLQNPVDNIEFEERVNFSNNAVLKIVYTLNPQKFSAGIVRLDSATAEHLGTAIFELGLRGPHMEKIVGTVETIASQLKTAV